MKPKEMKKLETALKVPLPWSDSHRGQPLDRVPSGLLKWTAENFKNDNVAEAADLVLQHREETDSHFY